MNHRPNQIFTRQRPTVSGLNQQCWLHRWFSKLAMLAVAGLVMLALSDRLQAADVPVAGTAQAQLSSPALDTNAPIAVASKFDVLDDKYKLAIGDQLSFRILEDEDDPVHLVVTDSGDIQVPYIGYYPVVGKTCQELAQSLKTELEKEYYIRATVIIAVESKPRSRGKVYIVGAVHVPGPQDISSEEPLTVSRAILRAGSFSDFADEKNVRITRGTGIGANVKTNFTVNVAQIFEKGKTENDVTLQPGDLIFVPERMIRF